MADVFIAAGPGEDAQARGLAEALALLGFDAASGPPSEADIAKTAETAKCVIALWTREAPPPWLAVLATLALERRKLVCAELSDGATPALFAAAPKIALSPRDRGGFKARFSALIIEIDKLSPAKADASTLPEALATARAALLRPSQARGGGAQWKTLGAFALAVGVLFVVGFGTGRVVQAVRSGGFAFNPTPVDAAQATPTAATGPSAADLETHAWRDVAAGIDAVMAERIKASARSGDASAQAMACLGHMAGAEGFLPSPSAALEFCNAGATQQDPAALYLSWVLWRNAPHAGIDEATARARLAEAAQRGWTAALIDQGLALAPDGRAPLAAQAEAGRLWLAAAERGDPRGQFFYARWLRDSPAGPRDPTAAIPFLERAVAREQPEALHMLATLHRDGIGVAANPARARALYERAARRQHTPAMFNLADMLRSGSAEDRAQAITLYRQLACMRDERQIQPLAVQRLRALHESAACS